MKILHILEDYSLNSGGLRTVVEQLNRKLIESGVDSYIISTEKEPNDAIFSVQSSYKPWRYSNLLKSKLIKLINENKITIFHIHGVWMYPQFIAAKVALKYKIPFIISPHGMYEPWLWLNGTLKKKFYFKFLAEPIFSKSKAIHAITNEENQNIKRLFPKINVIEIPNLIDYNAFSIIKTNSVCAEKYILFMGRIDKKKGIDVLIKAFAKLKINNLKLIIAGALTSYKIELDNLISSVNCTDDVIFAGRVTGNEKVELYKNALVFVAPSHSEVIGMVNLEAAVLKVPVITTYQTGLKKEWNTNGGILINSNEDELYLALSEVLSWNHAKRIEMGAKLSRFVFENYSTEKQFKKWVELYKNLSL